MSAEAQTTQRRVTFNSALKHSEENFKLMVKVLTHLAGTLEGQTFEGLWEHVSSKPLDYYRRHYRRENKRNNPLSGVKRPRTAYTFFTQERRNAIKEGNKDKSFGEISKLLAVEWHALSEKKRAAYVKREQADKARYASAKAELEAAEPVAEAVAEHHEEVAEPAAEPAPKSPTTKKSKTSAKKSSRKGAARK